MTCAVVYNLAEISDILSASGCLLTRFFFYGKIPKLALTAFCISTINFWFWKMVLLLAFSLVVGVCIRGSTFLFIAHGCCGSLEWDDNKSGVRGLLKMVFPLTA